MEAGRAPSRRHHHGGSSSLTRPQRRPRLVALDLDGTTLNPSHELNPRTVDVIRRVNALGVRVVLASGRLPHSIRPFAEQLGLPGVHIGLNGGVAFEGDVLRHKHTLTVEQLAFVHEVLADEGLDPMVFGAGGIWAPRVTDDVRYVLSYGEPDARTYPAGRYDLIEDPIKVLAVLPAGERDVALTARVEPRVHAIRTGPRFFEFIAPGVSKGTALREYLADLALTTDDVLTVGDSENDASLLESAGFAVAMGNAVPAIRALADVVTATNADDGVAEALERFVLGF